MRCFSWPLDTASWSSDGEINNDPKGSERALILFEAMCQYANAMCDREYNKGKLCLIMVEVSKTGGELCAAQVGCFADIGGMEEAA